MGFIGDLFGGKEQSISYAQSPEMQQLLQTVMPAFNKLSYSATSGQPLYNVPSTESMMPNQGWFNNLSPEIQQGLWEPTNIAARNMINQMGGEGMLSARGGYSGQSQAALGQLYGTAAPQIGMQAWNMISPIQQMGYQAQISQNAAPWQILPGMMGGTGQLTPNPVVNPAQPGLLSTLFGGAAGGLGMGAGMYGAKSLFG